jgi:signal transduction histidine kinase
VKIRTRLTIFFALVLFVMVLALSVWYQYRLFYVLRQESEKSLDRFTKGLMGPGRPAEKPDAATLESRLARMQNRDEFARRLSRRTWFTLYDEKLQALVQTPFAAAFPLKNVKDYIGRGYFTAELRVAGAYFKENNIESPPAYNLRLEHEFYTEEDRFTFFCLGKVSPVNTAQGTRYLVVLFPDNKNIDYLNQTLTNVIFSLIICLCLIIGLGLLYANYALSPLHRIIHELNDISEQNISRRVTFKNKSRDEIAVISQSINNLLDRIEKAFAMERRFISDVSHEFKTPISILQLNTEYIGNNPRLSDSEIDKVTSSLEILYSLNLLIQKLLYLSRLESDLSTFKPGTVEVRELLRSIITGLKPIAEKKELELSLHMQDENLTLRGDFELLSIALFNMIENALKYTEKGYVRVSTEEHNKTADIIIEDSGSGIPPDKIDKIFDKFYRAQQSSRDTQSFGIGLTIAKRILDIHGARIQIQSREHRNTRFTVSFARRQGQRSS